MPVNQAWNSGANIEENEVKKNYLPSESPLI
jgi:hypothetical protein